MFEFSKRSATRILLAGLVIFGLAVVLRTSAWWVMPWAFLEAVFYAVLFFIYFSLKPIRQYFLSLPGPHRVIFASFLTLMLVGQFADKPWLTFPFPTWSMYTIRRASEPISFFELRGLAWDGTAYRIDPAHLAGGGILTFSIVSRLGGDARGAFFATKPPEEREPHKRKLEDFMRVAGRVHNQEHPDQPSVERVELYYIEIDRHKKGEAAFERRKLWDVSL